MLPSVHVCARVARVAEEVMSSWTASVVQLQKEWGVPSITDWNARQATEAKTRAQIKQRVQKYMADIVKPTARDAELRWGDGERMKYPPTGRRVLADLLHTSDATTKSLRAWAQLRLQGRFTMRGMVDKAMCPLCRMHCDPSLSHLFQECPEARPHLEPLMAFRAAHIFNLMIWKWWRMHQVWK